MKKRIIAVLLALSMIPFWNLVVSAQRADIPYRDREFTVDTDLVTTAVDKLRQELEKEDNQKKVFDAYYGLLDLYCGIQTVRQMNLTELNKLNYGIESMYTAETINQQINAAVQEETRIAGALKSILNSRYADVFSEYWGEERTKNIQAINDEHMIDTKQFYDRYYALMNDNTLQDGDKAIACAGLLKEIVAYYNRYTTERTDYDNYIDYFYAENGGGYTADMVLEYCKNTAGPYWYIVNKYINYGKSLGLMDSPAPVKNEQEALTALKYVEKISPELKTAYDYLIRNGLCFLKTDSQYSMGMSFVMPAYADAGVMVSGQNLMGTLIHEFGHYYSFLDDTVSAEDMFFEDDSRYFSEFNAQAFELISTDYYEDIYGENAETEKFRSLTALLQGLSNTAQLGSAEIVLYTSDLSQISDQEMNQYMAQALGECWYQNTQLFIQPGNYIAYSLTLFDAIQVYDMYLHDREAGKKKYFEASSANFNGGYDKKTEQLGLVSAFDQHAPEYLFTITEDIFKTEYGFDYDTAMDYFENKVYLGKVYPTKQRISVDGGEPQTLFGYNRDGFNYIRIRDLAMLLNGTDKQFDVDYDETAYTVNIIPGEPYTADGTEMRAVPAVSTAGMKAAGTAALLYNGENTNFASAVFVNGWNCYRLRGLAEAGILDIKIDYDEAEDIVKIFTK